MASTRSRRICAVAVAGALAMGVAVACMQPQAHNPPGQAEEETNGVAGDEVGEGGERDGKDERGEGQDATGLEGSTPFDVRHSQAGTYAYEVSEPLERAASLLVCQYRDLGTCLVLQAGYIDLLGNVWGCVVEGPGWVDVCVVSGGSGDGSIVRIERMDPHDEEGLARLPVGEEGSRSVDG